VGFEIGRIDHDRLVFSTLGCQVIPHQGEHTLVAPSLPAVMERPCRAIFLRRIPPLQALAIDKDNAVQSAAIKSMGPDPSRGPNPWRSSPRGFGFVRPIFEVSL